MQAERLELKFHYNDVIRSQRNISSHPDTSDIYSSSITNTYNSLIYITVHLRRIQYHFNENFTQTVISETALRCWSSVHLKKKKHKTQQALQLCLKIFGNMSTFHENSLTYNITSRGLPFLRLNYISMPFLCLRLNLNITTTQSY